MRYTEKKFEEKPDDLVGAAIALFINFFMAPYRLVSEVSSKIVYIGKEAVDKICLATIVLLTVSMAWDVIWYFITGNISLWGGSAPLGAKFCALIISVWVGFYLSTSSTLSYSEEQDNVEGSEESAEVEVEVEEAETEIEEDYLVEEEQDQEILEDLSDNTELEVADELEVEIDTYAVSSGIDEDEEEEIFEDEEELSVGDLLNVNDLSEEEFEPIDSDIRDLIRELELTKPSDDALRELNPFDEVTSASLISSLRTGDKSFQEVLKSGVRPQTDNINLNLLISEES